MSHGLDMRVIAFSASAHGSALWRMILALAVVVSLIVVEETVIVVAVVAVAIMVWGCLWTVLDHFSHLTFLVWR